MIANTLSILMIRYFARLYPFITFIIAQYALSFHLVVLYRNFSNVLGHRYHRHYISICIQSVNLTRRSRRSIAVSRLGGHGITRLIA